MSLMDPPARTHTYSWARRNGLHNPYDFALHHEDSWGDAAALKEAARAWERRHLLDRKKRLEEELALIQERIQMVTNALDRNDEESELYG